MSNLAEKTELKALRILAKMVVSFEELQTLDMTREDDVDACKARNLLQGIIESNHYRIDYRPKRKGRILKDADNI